MVRNFRTILVAALLSATACIVSAAPLSAQSKDAEPATRQANAAVLRSLPFGDRTDFDDAQRGFIASLPDGLVQGPNGRPAISQKAFAFEQADDAPAMVNPSLWRQSKLDGFHGLFKVTDRVYQIRGLDIANMTIIEGDTGVIVIDTLFAAESAKAGMELYFQNRPRKPVVAVIYTHPHADHYGGVRGVISEDDVRSGKVQLIGPSHFTDDALLEGAVISNSVRRRSIYQFGFTVPPGERGRLDAGIGKALATGTFTFIPPVDSISQPYETRTIDGVEIEFHLVAGAEAPDEMVMYFPQFKLLNIAEVAVHTMHNLVPVRGADVRDAKMWSHHIADLLERYGDRTEILVAQHQWPTWGRDKITAFLKKQRDLYAFVHDQSVRLFNQGYTPDDIAESLKLPASLANTWATRGYYGSLAQDAKAVYQRYLGWFDANPAHLAPLPPVQQARKAVEYMGGADAAITRAREDFRAGNYRWVASVMNQVVFADPKNRAARDLEADAFEQLGYQSESAQLRNTYLAGAQELRNGPPQAPPPGAGISPDVLKAVPTELLFDVWAVRLNPARAEGKALVLNWTFTDSNTKVVVNLEDSVLSSRSGKLAAKADASFVLTRGAFEALLLKRKTVQDALAAGDIKAEGKVSALAELVGMLDDITPGYPIVEPRPQAD